jgi:hypothetical protein
MMSVLSVIHLNTFLKLFISHDLSTVLHHKLIPIMTKPTVNGTHSLTF